MKTRWLTSKIDLLILLLLLILQAKEHLKPEVHISVEKGQPSDTSCKPHDRSNFSTNIKIVGIASEL